MLSCSESYDFVRPAVNRRFQFFWRSCLMRSGSGGVMILGSTTASGSRLARTYSHRLIQVNAAFMSGVSAYETDRTY